MITNILVATDGSEAAIRGVQYAAYLASKLGCKVSLIHIVEFPPFPSSIIGTNEESRRKFENELRESGRSIIRLSQKPLSDAGIAVNYEVMEGRPADVICNYAKEGDFDLIIVGNRGRGKVSRLLLGSVSNEVVQAASCPVLIVRA
ncbi:MAG: universal stress protein [Candidatus Omnitrophica bacterium]|jgi:nucleotide-binding universal stress UspA family protein|nr:universal stress protein [Candidatus Omnitrophota bacterium]